ncbi:MAG TPA: succinylglutamate desuccinylase/aspartoacylase family protein [Alphaproteobacteria bacterium]|nr:succinylglutamate desuccinylase/aspartoacylase family protein [Alphaproteobacteria bacterium]
MTDDEVLRPPDISRWRDGNTGVDYVHRRGARAPGPHLMITALMHGNESCGAVALDRLLAEDVTPPRGTVTLAFLNIAAYAHIDPDKPERGRYVDEDMNRLWSAPRLEGTEASSELARARAIRPFVDQADHLLDLHSMTEGDTPLLLCGMTAKGRKLARRVGYPATVVADPGHAGGTRLRDYGPFGVESSEKSALLVECGAHFAAASAVVALETVCRFLAAFDMLPRNFVGRQQSDRSAGPQRLIEVTDVITITTDAFAFTYPCRPLEAIPQAGTLLARDGVREIRTPYDNCVPIMPARRLTRGLTAVRLGRVVESPAAS